MKILLLATTLMLSGCEKTQPSQPPKCTNDTAIHRFGKWEPDGGKSMNMTDWLKRQCLDCGWQEERGAKIP